MGATPRKEECQRQQESSAWLSWAWHPCQVAEGSGTAEHSLMLFSNRVCNIFSRPGRLHICQAVVEVPGGQAALHLLKVEDVLPPQPGKAAAVTRSIQVVPERQQGQQDRV